MRELLKLKGECVHTGSFTICAISFKLSFKTFGDIALSMMLEIIMIIEEILSLMAFLCSIS
jgi:hypothetical protein